MSTGLKPLELSLFEAIPGENVSSSFSQVLKRFVFFFGSLEAFGCRSCERHGGVDMMSQEEEEEEARERDGKRKKLFVN